MKRTALKRSTKPIRKRRAKLRRGPLICTAYRLWLKNKPCCVCHVTPCDPAHTKNNGTGSKGPDSSCAPLCRKHHEEYDAGRKAFEKKYALDMKEAAAAFWGVYQYLNGGLER